MLDIIIGIITIFIYSIVCCLFTRLTEGKITSDEYFKTFRVLWMIILVLGFALNILGKMVLYILGRLV
jgi:hypothetical protein